MEDVKTADLLPCPFCGPSKLRVGTWAGWFVKCECCGVKQGALTEERAIAEWNRRAAAPAPLPVRVEDDGSRPAVVPTEQAEGAVVDDPHDGGGTHPICRRLGGFADWFEWCLEGKFKLADTAPKFIQGLVDDLRIAARKLEAATPASVSPGTEGGQ